MSSRGEVKKSRGESRGRRFQPDAELFTVDVSQQACTHALAMS